jgi:nicotinamidase/pyrazinamidase
VFYPDVAAVAAEAATADLPPAAQDETNVHLLIVDMQVDFCHQQGSLYVPGAEEDIRRLSEFIFTHAGRITGITCTLDSHLPFQIFHPNWWADADGNHPDPFTLISQADVADGTWRPLVMPAFSKAYVAQLEEKAKKVLTIWPYHVLIGSVGNTLDGTVCGRPLPGMVWRVKASLPICKRGAYRRASITRPFSRRLTCPTIPRAACIRRAGLAGRGGLSAGGGGSGQPLCLGDAGRSGAQWERAQLERVYVLRDCMSPVQHPEVDFAAMAAEAFAEFAEAGMQFVKAG